MPQPSPYRPHDPGHNYYAPGIYLITLVTRGRKALLGTLGSDPRQPTVHLSEIGQMVQRQWELTPALQARQGRHLKIHAQVVMPDHWHAVVEVEEAMDKNLGDIIQAFKSACTARWRRMRGLPSTTEVADVAERIRAMSHVARQTFYDTPEGQPFSPLWDDNYDDTICLTDPATGAYDGRHLQAMVRYVADNPRRAIIRRQRPLFMQRCQHVALEVTTADGHHVTRDYAAFGNLFLLRWTRKVQVYCHRKAPDGHTPYETTPAYMDQCRQWKRMVMEGATVMVTPGISKGEQLIKNRCLESGYPLIHLQKESIGKYWKPEERRFNACCQGALLILAPWQPDAIGEVNGVPADTDYSIFHNLNMLAEEICRFEGEARLVL